VLIYGSCGNYPSSCYSTSGPPWPFPDCSSTPLSNNCICNTTLSIQARAQCILNVLTDAQKVLFFSTDFAGISSIGLPEYEWWEEGVHGLYIPNNPNTLYTTVYAAASLSGSSFNRSLWNAIGNNIANEARGYSNQLSTNLALFAPDINLPHDPRWGRGQEVPGEDPYVISEYAYQYVTGIQGGVNPKYAKASATCKHFIVYDLENWNGLNRFSYNAIVTLLDLVESYLPPFKMCVINAQADLLMCSYNAVNGVPSCANGYLLNGLVRNQWGFDGVIVSDCTAMERIGNFLGSGGSNGHNWVGAPYPNYPAGDPNAGCSNDMYSQMGVALGSGMDLDCSGEDFGCFGIAAIQYGALNRSDVDNSVLRVLRVWIEQGLFDPPGSQPYRSYGTEQVPPNNPNSIPLALASAQQSIVLLNNSIGYMPFTSTQRTTSKFAVVGPYANQGSNGASDCNSMPSQDCGAPCELSNYHGTVYPGIFQSLFTALSVVTTITPVTAKAAGFSDGDNGGVSCTVSLAATADIIIVAIGISTVNEDEQKDRTELNIPTGQITLVTQLYTLDKPMVCVVYGGDAVDTSPLYGCKA